MESLKGGNAAIHFHPADYGLEERDVTGRISASRSFLRGFLKHGTIDTAFCYASSKRHFSQFERFASELLPSSTETEFISFGGTGHLGRVGCLFRPDPVLKSHAWDRRLSGKEAEYSLCGITHTTCTAAAMDAMSDLFIAPIHSWDALICTSQAVYETVSLVLESWREYLAERLNARPALPLLMPIIPLGIDCDEFETGTTKTNRLQKYLSEDEIVVTYVGRLSHMRKAHPLPMFLALQEAVRRTGKRVRLFLVGWFQNKTQTKAFRDLGHEFAPDVGITALDGNKPAVVADAWRITDIFVSLSDNIQETFGLTPIEAMAAGIPVVVSDWNGYKETVRHGVDGFRVPTMLPPAGAGNYLGERFGRGQLSYEQYVGTTAASCVVEVDRCAEYLSELLANPELRRKMGAAGRTRARECYDWRSIIPQYQDLWRELSERRRNADPNLGATVPDKRHPLRQDPFRIFASYASATIDETIWLELVSRNPGEDLAQIKRHDINAPRTALFANDAEMRSILNQLRHGAMPLEALLATRPVHEHAVWYRTVAWLGKMGLLRLQRSGSD